MIGIEKDSKILKLRLYGFIGKGWFADVSADAVNYAIDRATDIEEIQVRLHSPGGSIAEGCAIYNSLKNHKAKVKVVIDGECCSIATVIAMAGDEIAMSPVSTFMIHNPFVQYISGGADDLRNMADTLDKLKEIIINAYVTKTKCSREEISAFMDGETYFTPEKALEKGFITEIINYGENQNSNGAGRYSYQIVPENYFNFNKNKKESEEDMSLTIEKLKNEYPEIYNAVREDAISSERERMRGLDIWASKTAGAENIIKKYKYEEPKNANEVFEELLNYVGNSSTKNEENFIEKFENKKKDAQNSGIDNITEIDTQDLKDGKNNEDIAEIVDLANSL